VNIQRISFQRLFISNYTGTVTNEHEKIALISDWFDKELITDWNVCDWLCVRLLTPMIDNWTKDTLRELKKWNKIKTNGKQEPH
jgi:hypothetical protein